MLKTALLLISSVILFAGEVTVGLKNHNGNSSYTVQSDKLKAKLDFPFKFNTLDLEYRDSFKGFEFNLHSSLLLNSKTTKGEDFDWKDDALTVYSYSDNKVDKYYSLGLDISKDITQEISLFVGFDYKTFDMYWSNTYQEDYVQNESSFIPNKTLEFQQDFYQYSLGLNYADKLTEKIFYNFSPSFVYAFVNTKDIHILRDFYTIQNTQSLGYELNLRLGYSITQNASINLSLAHIDIKDNNVAMDYYNILDEKFASFASSYSYKNSAIDISYTYKF